MTDLGAVRRNLAATVGVVAAVAAVAVAVVPGLSGAVAGPASLLGSESVVLVLSVAVALAGIWLGYTWRERATEDDGEADADDGAGRVGAGIDDAYRSLIDEDGDTDTLGNRRQVRSKLRAAAIEAITEGSDVSHDTATERVDTGEWTDDRRAAAFLGESAPPTPLQARMADWIDGATVERQVWATVEAIAQRSELDVSRESDESDERVPRTDDARTDSVTVRPDDGDSERGDRWVLPVLGAFALSGIGFLTATPTLVAASVIPLAYAAYGYATRAPEPVLSVRRELTDGMPAPGETVRVEVTVENVGDRPVPSLVVTDGVPERLRLLAGPTAGCAALEPGESTTAGYTVSALRGDHEFDPIEIRTAGVAAGDTWTVTADPETPVTCRDPLSAMPANGVTTAVSGRVPTDAGGPGIEFYSTREYHAEDPLSQVDFNHWAKTGEPRTIEFRQTRAAAVLVVLDDRDVARKRRHEWSLDAVVLGRFAGSRVAEELLAADNAVGAASMAARTVERPRRGSAQHERIETLWRRAHEESDEDDDSTYDRTNTRFFTNPAFDEDTESDDEIPAFAFGREYIADGGRVRWLRRRLDADTQVLVVTPLLDDEPVSLARRLAAEGNQVRLLCPDVTAAETPGSAIARLRRRRRQRALRDRGIGVVDWPTDRPLSVAVSRARERWSR